MKTQEALNQISYLQELITQTRLRASDSYPYFLLWGTLSVLGYLSMIWLPYSQLLIWSITGCLGAILSVIIGFTERKGRPVPPLLKKLGWLGLILLLYGSGVFRLLLMVTKNIQILYSYWPFQIGLIYLASGIFVGRQFLFIGGWIMLMAVTGLWMPPMIQAIWLAAGAGGGLIFTGILLRKQAIKNE
ncbi:MAG TPA: hypothetical protein VHY08_25380 [Bacillota bacterium]|nr:hypothetical protein [Bacillota bacterium]